MRIPAFCHPNKCTFKTAAGASVVCIDTTALGPWCVSMSGSVCSIKEEGERICSAGLQPQSWS